jgi:hypothetical protein
VIACSIPLPEVIDIEDRLNSVSDSQPVCLIKALCHAHEEASPPRVGELRNISTCLLLPILLAGAVNRSLELQHEGLRSETLSEGLLI